MASILDRYGIKEVADVTFYEIDESGNKGRPVLFLDTLKVSTIEQTAEQVDARGGKGNPKLVTWDYGKEINVTIEDALFSPKSMSIMLGNGVVPPKAESTITRTVTARVIESATDSTKGTLDYMVADVYDSTEKGAVRKKIDLASDTARAGMISFAASKIKVTQVTDEQGNNIGDATPSDVWTRADLVAAAANLKGQKIFITYLQAVEKTEIVVSGDTFPGTYYIQGDTYARSDVTGKDQFFQFIIPKAKMTAEQTITLEAEGDPSVFNMNLTVLRPEDGDMMKLVQYDLIDKTVQ